MEIKQIANNTLNFSINRIIELIGLSIVIIGLLLSVALFSYTPEDPNFIFSDKTNIKNQLVLMDVGAEYNGPFKPSATVNDTSALTGNGSFFTGLVLFQSPGFVKSNGTPCTDFGVAPPPVPLGDVGTFGPRGHGFILE